MRHIANGAAQVLQIEAVNRRAVEQDAPVLRLVKAQQQFHQSRFTRAGGPDKSRGLPGGDGQVDAVQRWRVAGRGIRKTHIFQAHFTAHAGLGEMRALVGNAGRRIQQAHGALDGGHGALVHIGHIGQRGHGPQQALGQKHQHRERAHGELVVQRQPAAVEQRGGKARQNRHADHRRDGRAHADRALVALAVAVAGVADVLRLQVLGGKGFDGGQPEQVVVQPRTHITRRFAHLGIARRQALLEPERAKQNQRHWQQRHHRNARLHRKKHGTHQHRGTQHLDDLVGPAVQKTLHLVDVVVQDSHQVAGALVLEIRHVQPLHMAVGVQPQIVLQVLRQLPPLHLVQILEQRLATPDQHIERTQRQQLLPGAGDPQTAQYVARQKTLLALDHHIHRRANQHFGQDVEELVENRIQRGFLEVAAVGGGVVQEFA